MAGEVSTTTAVNFIPTLWSLEVIEAYYNNTVMMNLVDRSFQELQKAGMGNKIRVPIISALGNWGAINIGSVVPEYTEVTESYVDIDVTTFEGIKIKYQSLSEIQAMSSIRQNYTREMGLTAAKAIDTTVCALVASISQNVGTLAVDLTDDNILRGEQYLMDANVPTDDWFLVVGPAQLQGFRKIDKYANMLYKASAGTIAGNKNRGYVGPLYNCDVYQTTQVVSNTSGHDNVMFQKKWCALIVQQEPKVEQWRNVAYAIDEVICWAVWGAKQMRATSGIWMKGL